MMRKNITSLNDLALISVLRRDSKSYRNIFDRRHATFEDWYRKFLERCCVAYFQIHILKWDSSYYAILQN